MASVRRNILPAVCARLLLCALIPANALAQQIYKWTDANGQVHYTDQPPPDRAAGSVAVDKGPTPPPPPPAAAGNRESVGRNDEPYGQPSVPTDNRSAADKRIAATNEDFEKRQLAASREAEKAATRKAADDAVIAACERAHDVQCNKGADFIRKREEDLAQWQYIDRRERWIKEGRNGPPPQPPPPRTMPVVQDSNKK